MHNIFDDDPHFLIDAETRAISCNGKEVFVMQYDHNSECITFECDRYVEGYDLTACNMITVNYLINGNNGVYNVSEVQVKSDDSNKIQLCWLISSALTEEITDIAFLLCFSTVDVDGSVSYVWNTDIYKSIPIREGIGIAGATGDRYPDIFEAWKIEIYARLKAVEDDLAVQQARVDQLTTLQEGSTTGDAELQDIRVGADGTVYTNAGTAVREQFASNRKDCDAKMARVIKESFNDSVPVYLMTGVIKTDGSIGFTTSHHAMVTDYVAVTGGETYVYSGRSNSEAVGAIFYDSDFNVTGYFNGSEEYEEYTNTVPAGASYARFQSYQRTDVTPKLTVKFTATKIISFLGDSITAGIGGTNLYHMIISEQTKAICKNYGCSGTGFVHVASGTTSRWGQGETGVAPARELTGSNSFLDRASTIDANSDLIVVFGGTNDYGSDITIDEFKTAVGGVIDYFQSNLPTTPLLFLTPLLRNKVDSSSSKPDGKVANYAGYTLTDYVDALIEVCGDKGVMCIDLYRNSGVNPYNSVHQSTLTTDGLHPNNAGHTYIAKCVSEACKQLIN